MLSGALLRRGDIVIAADRSGEFSGKPRPVVLLQAPERLDEASPLPVVMITTTPREAPLLRVALPSDSASGLTVPSWAAIDLVTTVRRRRLRRRIGHLDPAVMLAIDRALMVYLGLA